MLFPAVLTALAGGCGLLVERALGAQLPGALLAPVGLAVVVVIGGFLTLADATAELTTPVVVAVAAAGLAAGLRAHPLRGWGWPAAAAASAFGLYAAPIVLSGEATFAGYIKLDDTATWMALTDRVMEHGRSLDGLAPSTHEATLAFNLDDGYPIGAFLPLGVGHELIGEDVAWLIQPYMAWLGALLALALWQISGSLLESGALRALVAVGGSQSALLYGYYLWGGVKEVAAAALLATAVPLALAAVSSRGHPRAVVAPAVVCAALIGVLSAGGTLWLASALLGALALLAAGAGRRPALRAAAWATGLVALLSLPVLLAGGLLPPTSSPLTSSGAQGSLFGALEPGQVAGIWPAGDFRLDPGARTSTYALVALVAVAAAGALVLAWRRREWALPLYVCGTLSACAVIWALGSPWVAGKALATASPALPLAAALAGAALYARGLRVEGGALLLVVLGGVLWSNALQYRDASLAPRDQLAELELIGEAIAGQGPTLMTEYQPYGARHFLREADPEAASELRRRPVSLRDGGTLAKGETADTDRLDPAGLHLYRTLVLRRSPSQSRPPLDYQLSWRGRFYEVWQRSGADGEAPARLALGAGAEPTARPACPEVLELADGSGPRDTLAAAHRPKAIVVRMSGAERPDDWTLESSPRAIVPRSSGSLEVDASVPADDRYGFWLRGSVRPAVELSVDDSVVGEVRHRLNHEGQYVELGAARLTRGEHRVKLEFSGADLSPGSGAGGSAIGPLVLARSEASEVRITTVSAARARLLCGRRWDWIELRPKPTTSSAAGAAAGPTASRPGSGRRARRAWRRRRDSSPCRRWRGRPRRAGQASTSARSRGSPEGSPRARR